MKFREALQKVKRDDQIKDIALVITKYVYHDDLKVKDIINLTENIRFMIDTMITLESVESNVQAIAVIKTLDFDIPEGSDKPLYSVTYQAFMLEPSDNSRYGLLFVDWKELIDAEILDSSIHRYGLPTVLASILYELSFLGYDYNTMMVEREKTIEKLREAELDKSECRDADEVMDELFERYNIPKPTKEEREREENIRNRASKYIKEEYDKEAAYILGAAI